MTMEPPEHGPGLNEPLPPARKPTQVKHPWRAVARTVVAGGIAFIPIGTYMLQEANLHTVPAVAAFISLGALITRVLAMPTTERFLRDYIPWLAAAQYEGKHRESKKNDYL